MTARRPDPRASRAARFTSRAAWVFHAGALGDFVMIWPLLRALHSSGRSVTVCAPASKAALAAAELGVGQVNIENPRFMRLWQGPAAVKPSDVDDQVGEVYSFLADEATAPGQRWLAGARAMFPGARVAAIGPPGSPSRAAAWAASGATGDEGRAARRESPAGPVVLHVGAGSATKRWPMERWHALREAIAAGALGMPAPAVVTIGGEVEAEQFTTVERRTFAVMDGRFLEKLGDLAGVLRGARVYVGADSGPTHLAAQLGVPTVALFGPTDAHVWAPAGPRVRVLAGERPRAMAQVDGASVLAAVREAI